VTVLQPFVMQPLNFPSPPSKLPAAHADACVCVCVCVSRATCSCAASSGRTCCAHQEQFINDRAFLLRCVEAAGLPTIPAAAILDDPTGGEAEQLVAQELGKYSGVTGVPHFVLAGRWAG